MVGGPRKAISMAKDGAKGGLRQGAAYGASSGYLERQEYIQMQPHPHQNKCPHFMLWRLDASSTTALVIFATAAAVTPVDNGGGVRVGAFGVRGGCGVGAVFGRVGGRKRRPWERRAHAGAGKVGR